ncbi:cell division protein FtsZ [Magnetospirillum aberrantis]|uniref:Cell division protein FtsZ n=1 Tax=Magnetospirillum aberrantis SpK TaxID=908842 RepID=A0A7C9V058_9PROT|nr:cell division protein FtsZ [Magnetospirillum aberrantis]NFV81235.1 cell division protein FtsZ [Magnetospirillum aberrantis SpK]
MLTFLPGAPAELKPKITVVGVGGAGGNAVNNMISSKLEGVEFIVANTDAQAIAQSRTERRVQLGTVVTQGLGAGSRPDIGRAAAEESLEEIIAQITGANMVFITAGMGGGTGSGAAPVIAQAAREQNILTVGVVTKPFHFEGAHRMRTAEAAIEELSQYVDTLIIIPNQNLFRIATERTTFADAFKMADDVLYSGVRGVTDLMVMPGLINLDFADIRTVMSEMGKAMMGTGEAEGDKRAIAAAEAAISNPLLDDTSMKGAKGVLINITGGLDMTLFEVDEAANRIRDEVDPDANIIFGSTFDEKLNGKMRVSVVATGIASEAAAQPKPTVISLAPQQASPAQMRTAPAQQPAFRPSVVSSQAAPAPEPAVARVKTAPMSSAATMQAVAFETSVDAVEQEQPATRAEMRVERPEPAYQPEMRMEQPQPRAAAQVREEMPVREQLRVDPDMAPLPSHQPDMASLTRAVSDIADSHHPSHQAPHARHAEQEPRRMGGLFDLLRRPARQPAQHEPVQPAAPAQQAAPQQAQPRMASRGEPATARSAEDLDIPAFLRRQAN